MLRQAKLLLLLGSVSVPARSAGTESSDCIGSKTVGVQAKGAGKTRQGEGRQPTSYCFLLFHR